MNAGVPRAAAIALNGLQGTPVLVEAAIGRQLPGMAIIGLPDAALAESKLRVRTAIAQAALAISDRFLTINLSPAAIPKHGSSFDLAIALAALAASGELPADRLAATAHIGELGLDGGVRRPAGLLGAVVAARDLGFERVMVPAASRAEAALVPGIEVVTVPDLGAAAAWHRRRSGAWSLLPGDRAREIAGPLPRTSAAETPAAPDMADIIGQDEAVEAMVVAAAGRHHISLTGPPGAGKTLLASRLPSILPDLTPDEALTASCIASLGGAPLTELILRPPFEHPHHTASPAAIIGGGGAGGIRAGAITRACHGVLLLDETPLFSSAVLDALRQPLESGIIGVHRAQVRAEFPARIQLVLAANPCPCGNADAPDPTLQCNCTPMARRRYFQRLSGPLRDRIDISLRVRRVSNVLLAGSAATAPTSGELRSRVRVARERAASRLDRTPWRVNAEVPGSWLRGHAKLPRGHTAVLDQALGRGAITLRGYDRTLRVAWTLADLEGRELPGRSEIARALALREGALR